jgi:hypothetical protein
MAAFKTYWLMVEHGRGWALRKVLPIQERSKPLLNGRSG